MSIHKDNFLIISFTDIEDANRVSKRIENKLPKANITVKIIEKNDNKCNFLSKEELRKIDNQSKIYIIGHCESNYPSITHDGKTQAVTYIQLADSLKQEGGLNVDTVIDITLLACEAGIYDRSFAMQLHSRLGQSNSENGLNAIQANVSAYTKPLVLPLISDNGIKTKGKSTIKNEEDRVLINKIKNLLALPGLSNKEKQTLSEDFIALLKFQEPGSKVMFCWNSKKEQIMLDAHIELFVRRSKKVINELSELFLSMDKEKNFDKEIIKPEIESIKNKLLDIEKIDGQEVKNLCREMVSLNERIMNLCSSPEEKEKYLGIFSKTQEILEFAKRSIAPEAKPAVRLGTFFDASKNTGLRNDPTWIELLHPIEEELKKIPEGKAVALKNASEKVFQNVYRSAINQSNLSFEKYVSQFLLKIVAMAASTEGDLDETADRIPGLRRKFQQDVLAFEIPPSVTGQERIQMKTQREELMKEVSGITQEAADYLRACSIEKSLMN